MNKFLNWYMDMFENHPYIAACCTGAVGGLITSTIFNVILIIAKMLMK